MQQLRLGPTLSALLGSSILLACDAEQDFHDDIEMADELDDEELDELDLEATSNEQTTEETAVCTVSPGVPGASFILANNQNVGMLDLGISVPGTGYYDFDLTQSIPPYLSSFEIQRQAYPYSVVASDLHNLGLFLFIAHDQDRYDITLQAPLNATPGSTYLATVRLNTDTGHCNHNVNMRIADCRAVGWWSTNPWPTPWFDNANCYVANLPPGQQSFVWNDSWYVKPTNGNQCAIGVFDNANCYIGSAPGGHTAFIWNNSLYYTP